MRYLFIALFLFAGLEAYSQTRENIIRISDVVYDNTVVDDMRTTVELTLSGFERNAHIVIIKKGSGGNQIDCTFHPTWETYEYLDKRFRGYPTRFKIIGGFSSYMYRRDCRFLLNVEVYDKNRNLLRQVYVSPLDRVTIGKRKSITISHTDRYKRFFEFEQPIGCPAMGVVGRDIGVTLTPRLLGYDCQYGSKLRALKNGVKIHKINWSYPPSRDVPGCCVNQTYDGKACKVVGPSPAPALNRGFFHTFLTEGRSRVRSGGSFSYWLSGQLEYTDPEMRHNPVIHIQSNIYRPGNFALPMWFRASCLPNNQTFKLFPIRMSSIVFSVPEYMTEDDLRSIFYISNPQDPNY
jgi:hypothetical protein